jgi:hypothetical protein
MDASIISLWPSAEHFAEDIGLKWPGHARVMRLRGRIPEQYREKVLAAAKRRGIELPAAQPERAA